MARIRDYDNINAKPDSIENLYFNWLCDMVMIDTHTDTGDSYWLLAKKLHKREFVWVIDLDENRADDGVALRTEFEERERIYIGTALDRPCSVLEMLVALSIRWDDIMTPEVDDGHGIPEKFWEMMSNIGLDKFSDDEYYPLFGDEMIDDILDKLIARSYDFNGHGGLFPLKKRGKNQRRVEIWYQMMAYLDENYYIEDKIR